MKTNIKQSFRVMKRLSLGLSLAFLATLSYQVLFPSAPSNAAEATAELEVVVEPTLEMALDKTSVTLIDRTQCEEGDSDAECAAKGVLPDSAGTQVTADINVYVTTNNSAGYALSLYTQDTSADMKHINSYVTASIEATNGGESLGADEWGFQSSFVPGSWVGVGTEANPQSINEHGAKSNSICSDILAETGDVAKYEECAEDGNAEKNTITFGANITDSLPSGRYTNDVVFSAVALPDTVSGH